MEMNMKLLLIRKSENLTQEQFAERVGLTRGAYSLIESGKNKSSLMLLKLVCYEFNINEDWLFKDVGEMKKSNSDIVIHELDEKVTEMYNSLSEKSKEKLAEYLNKFLS